MKKSLLNVFVVQILLNLFIFLYIISFPNEQGIYDIPKSELWPIVTALILFLLSHFVEYLVKLIQEFRYMFEVNLKLLKILQTFQV